MSLKKELDKIDMGPLFGKIPAVRHPHDPSTPDDDVSPERLKGRKEYQAKGGDAGLLRPTIYPVEFWLGWYDERLKRFYDRA